MKAEYNIQRPAYHGGQYIGKTCQQYMKDREKVFKIIIRIIEENDHEQMSLKGDDLQQWATRYKQ